MQPVEGRPDLHFGVQSDTGGGSFLPLPKAEGKFEPILHDGKPTGWGKFPDGNYRRLVGEKDVTDYSNFDADNDGILSAAEYGQAVMAQKMGGEAYPGMKVKKGEAQQVGARGYKSGSVYGGMRFKGGDPNDEKNWEKIR